MAFAQWLPKSRRGAGSYTVNNVTIPAGVDTVRLKLDVTPADFTTPVLVVRATIETSLDGAAWHHHATVERVGCTPEPRGPGGPMGWVGGVGGLSRWAGGVARVSFETLGGAFRWGLLGEIVA